MKPKQQMLFPEYFTGCQGFYKPYLTAIQNNKGVLDVDTVKGCYYGLLAHPEGGCYGECYAYKIAKRYGIKFSSPVSRHIFNSNRYNIFSAVKNHYASWFRVGTSGDTSHDWDHTIDVLQFLKSTGKTPVIITKHWLEFTDDQLLKLSKLSVVVNTSISALDTDEELNHRIQQIGRISYAKIKSVARVVTCNFADTQWGNKKKRIQEKLLKFQYVIDTPLRASKNNKYVERGDILLTRRDDSIGGGKYVSLHYDSVYLGTCDSCPDQCGAEYAKQRNKNDTRFIV
jgi:hypothetical protein